MGDSLSLECHERRKVTNPVLTLPSSSVPQFSIYCASKWAVEGFTESISHELKPEWNIRVQCVEPGGFR